ncbi:hypothetical protein E6O75_ATG07114 [Venturia nashicola]|uniref:Uncharacterized protein n=1 Tax=Venturia nashicola TaxID=86259 RepID=A0A4Z1P129_9PEZI|nr:hypothetical protein E6O75_ATG07114 [Venturia nashicola]
MSTTFLSLSLSLELRQEILFLSFDAPYTVDIALNVNVTSLRQMANYVDTLSIPQTPGVAPKIAKWALILKSSHPVVSMDLDFVLKKTFAMFEDEAVATMAMLVEGPENENDVPQEVVLQAWEKQFRWGELIEDWERWSYDVAFDKQYSFDDVLQQDVALSVDNGFFAMIILCTPTAFRQTSSLVSRTIFSAPHILAKTSVLNPIDITISDDLQFVLDQTLKGLEQGVLDASMVGQLVDKGARWMSLTREVKLEGFKKVTGAVLGIQW